MTSEDEGRRQADKAAQSREGTAPPSITMLKVFVSSPGDVAGERAIVRDLVQRIPREPLVSGKMQLELVAWDDPDNPAPLTANEAPQSSVVRYKTPPSECDLTVVILWRRMGSLQPAELMKPDGTRFESGTEWEYENAKAANKEIWVYARTAKPDGEVGHRESQEEVAQYEATRRFLTRIRQNADGSVKGGVNEYSDPAAFSLLFRKHLECFLRLHIDGGTQKPVDPAPRSEFVERTKRAALAVAIAALVVVGLRLARKSPALPEPKSLPAQPDTARDTGTTDFTILPDIEFGGTIIDGSELNSGGVNECALRCERHPKCRAFTFKHGDYLLEDQGHCTLRSNVVEELRAPGTGLFSGKIERKL